MKNTVSNGRELSLSVESVERRIFLIRKRKVMFDRDLAEIYGVETRALVQAVGRNLERFPDDFMFRLTGKETISLRSQFVILDNGRGRHSKYAPYAFTELGIAMLSSVLRSKHAVRMNILIMRAFVQLREMLVTHHDLVRSIEEIRRHQEEQQQQITSIIETISQLWNSEPASTKRRIGFHAAE